MEYPVKNDFFLEFKPVFDKNNNFEDYILLEVSKYTNSPTKDRLHTKIGKRLSELVIDKEDIPFLKDLYYHMLPGTKRKFERYDETIDTWYMISIFSDDRDYLLLFYSDITKIKKDNSPGKVVKDVDGDLKDLHQSKMVIDYYKDRLTGLYNKSFLKMELSRLDTERQLPISIISGDMNGLKLINDAFGHTTGDEAIKRVADIMKKMFRKEDIVCRWGGDEFVILLPNTEEALAEKKIQMLKRELEKQPLDFLHLSVSFGLASKNKMEEDIYFLVTKAEEKMYFNKLVESKETKRNILDHLQKKLETISYESKNHHDRLLYYSSKMADKLNLSEIEKQKLYQLCKYHDIGKAGIPDNILQKKTPLDNEEWSKIKRHSEIGYHIMKSCGEISSLDELILMHHERWDGKGYPGLIKGKEIPLIVRIFSIADAYEAMVNHRPYKERLTQKEALEEIRRNAGSQFDPKLAEFFIGLVEKDNLNAV